MYITASHPNFEVIMNVNTHSGCTCTCTYYKYCKSHITYLQYIMYFINMKYEIQFTYILKTSIKGLHKHL